MGLARVGYAALSGLVKDAIPLKRLAAAKRGSGIDASCTRPHNTLTPLAWNDDLVQLLLTEQVLARVRDATAATDLRWISGYVSTKEPRSPPLWWHQDWWCWDHPISQQERAAQVALLLYLDNTDAANGALRVLPGSHRRRHPVHDTLVTAQVDDVPTDHPSLASQVDELALPARAGDAFVLDYRLLHGTYRHDGAQSRECVILNFAPHWRELPDEIRSHLIQQPSLNGAPRRPPYPHYAGTLRDLPLSRDPRFAVTASVMS